MELEEQIKHRKDLEARRKAWDEEFTRRKEEERLQQARDELAREKKHRRRGRPRKAA